MVSAAVAAVICGCGHAERLHERDSAGEDDRGVCFQRSCGCSEYRVSGEAAAGDIPANNIPANVTPMATPVVEADAVEGDAAGAALWPCIFVGCGRRFDSVKALHAHQEVHNDPVICGRCGRGFSRRAGLTRHVKESHGSALVAVETGSDADSPSLEPDQPTDGAVVAIPPAAAVPPPVEPEAEPEAEREGDEGQDCGNCGDTVIALSPRGWCDGCEEEAAHLARDQRAVLIAMGKEANELRDTAAARSSTIRTLTARLVFDGAPQGSVLELNLVDIGQNEFTELTRMILRYMTGERP